MRTLRGVLDALWWFVTALTAFLGVLLCVTVISLVGF
jgi:hypothetical protein